MIHWIHVRDIRLTLVAMALALGLLVGLPTIPAHAVTVVIPDAGLESAVRNWLAKPTGDISDSDMRSLTTLWVSGDIDDLTGLQYATNLTQLRISSYGQLSDIAPLASLTNLTEVWLTCRELTDITPVGGLTKLTVLGLTGSQVVDITPLANLTSLRRVALDWNQVTDITPLAGLTNLASVGLNGNYIADISPLSGLTNLVGLDLSSNMIADIAPVSGLANLSGLQLHDNQIADITPLTGLSSLRYLGLHGNQITDISPVAGLTGLTELDLNGNRIFDLAPVAGLVNLEYLHLSDNKIADITPVAGLTRLNRLFLSDNVIADITPVANLTNLSDLHLADNQFTEIAALAGLNKLMYLSLSNNYLDLRPDSPTMAMIEAVLARTDVEENVEYIPQRIAWVVTPTTGTHGFITPSTRQRVVPGTIRVFTMTPETGYHVADVLVDGASVGAVTSHTLGNVKANHTISATFAINSYTISASAGANGTVTPSGLVDHGTTKTFTITPVNGYRVADVLVDGVSVGALTSYTFTNVTANHTISASFSAMPRVNLGAPTAPKTMKRSKSYTVHGWLKPRHANGTKPVRIYKYKKAGDKWKSYGYVKAIASNYGAYSRYKVKMKLTSKGKWRLRACAPADSKHATTWSSKYDYVRVK